MVRVMGCGACRAFAALGGSLESAEDFWWHGIQRYGRKALYSFFLRHLGTSAGDDHDRREDKGLAIPIRDLTVTPTGQARDARVK
jgi:hypothetical protein